jgi:hypothetical protein
LPSDSSTAEDNDCLSKIIGLTISKKAPQVVDIKKSHPLIELNYLDSSESTASTKDTNTKTLDDILREELEKKARKLGPLGSKKATKKVLVTTVNKGDTSNNVWGMIDDADHEVDLETVMK